MKKYFDLSMFIDENTPVYPGDPKPEIKISATVHEHGWLEKKIINFTSHFSTHIDAPIHMIENGKTLDEFPTSTFFGNGIVLDFNHPRLDKVQEGDFVFLYTGQTEKMYSEDFFKDNPEIPMELAKKLIERKIKIVGIDSFTVDSEPFTIHKEFLKNDILIVENLVNLKELINKRFECFIFPMKIKDADGAPARIVARIEPS